MGRVALYINRAAGGDQDERWPWGTDWDESRANTDENGVNSTTPVWMYPAGCSDPFGVWDMGGNVWEWLDTWYDSDKDSKALRGGSWYYDRGFARVGRRYWDYPDYSDSYVGFRVVFSPAGSGS